MNRSRTTIAWALVSTLAWAATAVAETPKEVEVVSGALAITNLPAVQEVAGSMEVTNLPAVQEITGTVEVGNFPEFPPIVVENGVEPLEVRIDDVVRTRPIYPSTRHGFFLLQADASTPPEAQAIRTGIVLTDLVVANLTNTAVCTFILYEEDPLTGEAHNLMILRLSDQDVRDFHFQAGFFSSLVFDEPNLFVIASRATLSSECSVGVTYSGFER